MDYMDSNKIGQRIENKLIHALGRTISEAANDEIYKAAAECIRDDILGRQQKKDTRARS